MQRFRDGRVVEAERLPKQGNIAITAKSNQGS